ncbi:hypothetical protein [Spongiimicrobium sp. 3-5]|uniref:hypothetical protein n=1 Tax=Spongiimicrobium sp. 3-5 TaxID=3332596 RepID=UPI0039811398
MKKKALRGILYMLLITLLYGCNVDEENVITDNSIVEIEGESFRLVSPSGNNAQAINAALLLDNVLLEDTTYIINQAIIDIPSDRKIMGKSRSIIKTDFTSHNNGLTYAFRVDGKSNVEISKISFEVGNRLIVNGNPLNQSIIDIRNSNNVKVTNCSFYGHQNDGEDRGACISSTSSEYIEIRENIAEGHWARNFGFNIGTKHFWCEDNIIKNNNNDVANYDIDYKQRKEGNIPFLKGNGGFGIHTNNSEHGVIKNNYIFNNGREPLNINGGSRDIVIAGNVINGTGDGGILLGIDPEFSNPITRITVQGNYIEGCHAAGVVLNDEIDDTSFVNILNNVCLNNGLFNVPSTGHLIFESGIYVAGSYVSVIGNVLQASSGFEQFQRNGIYIQDSYGQNVLSDPFVLISGNSYTNQQNNIGITHSSGPKVNYQLDIQDGIEEEYPALFDLTTVGGIPAWENNLTEWRRNTNGGDAGGKVNAGIDGNNCLFSKNGGYHELKLINNSLLTGKNVILSFYAKNVSTTNSSGSLVVQYSFMGISKVINMSLDLEDEWKKYVFRIPTRPEGYDVLKFDFRTQTGEIYFDKIKVSTMDFNF